MTELERYKGAMKIALDVLDVCTRHMENERYTASTIADLARINAILNPQEFEEVEVVRWGCLDCDDIYMTEITSCPERAHHTIAKLTGTIRRAVPQKVERSVSVKGKADSVGDIDLEGRFGLDFIHGRHVENKIPAGSDVQITFTWTE